MLTAVADELAGLSNFDKSKPRGDEDPIFRWYCGDFIEKEDNKILKDSYFDIHTSQ